MKYKPLFYLASPFTHKLAKVRKERINLVTTVTVKFVQNLIHVFSPISYNGNWERRDLPGTWTFWEEFDINYLKRCDGLIVLMLDGWDKSVGVAAEIEYAKKRKMPICYVTYDTIKNGDVSKVQEMETKILEQRKPR